MRKINYIATHRRQRGFTMIELVIVVTLVAVLASVAVPSMRTYILNNRVSSTSQELLRTLQTARSEAAKRQRNIVVCASANPTAGATATCTTSTPSGWIMFEDVNADWARASTDNLLEAHTFDSAKLKVLLDGSKRIAYAPTGFAAVGSGSAPQIRSTGMVVCDSRGNVDSGGGTSGPSVARGIYVDPTGRARITRVISSSSDAHDLGELLSATGSSC